MANDTLLRLKTLQETDDAIKVCKDTFIDLSMRREQSAAKMAQLREHLASFTENLESRKKRQRELEGESASLADKLATSRKKLDNVKSAAEYNALTHEVEFLTGRLKAVDDTLLEYMELLEEAEKDRAAMAGEVERLAGLCQKEAEGIAATLAENDAKQAGLEAKRRGVAEALPEATLKRYEAIRKDRKGLAVTPASGGKCLACRMAFPPQLFNDLQKNEAVIACPNCGRLMYWREHPDFLPEA